VAASEVEHIPLSFGQEQLWFLDQLSPGESTYNVPVLFRLVGALDVEVLRQSLTVVVARHDVLRTRFGSVDGEPFQSIASAWQVDLPVEDLTALPAEKRWAAADRAAAREAERPFDLTRGPLFRSRLLRMSPHEHLLCVTIHHAVTDGWSMSLLNSELSTTYAALIAGQEPRLPDLPVQYPDVVRWQRRRLREGRLEPQLRYWESRLAGLPVVELPSDRPRPATPSHRGGVVTADVPDDLRTALSNLAREHDASLFMVLAAATAIVLARYTGQEDLPIGTTMLGRTEPELERLIGLFVNLVVLRADLSDDPIFAELLARIRDEALAAYDHQEVPFEKVVERVQPVRDTSRNPLFDVCVQLLSDSAFGGGLTFPGIEATSLVPRLERARFDMSLTFVESSAGLRLHVEYATDLFDRWRVEQLVRHLERTLRAASDNPAVRLSEVRLLSEDEWADLHAWGRGPEEPFRHDPVHVMVAEQARVRPDAVAAVFDGEMLTYGELDRRAEVLARYLRAMGVGHEDLVPVALERGLDVWVALLGVLKAGAAFAVLDTASPPARLAFILGDTEAEVVLTSSDTRGQLPEPVGWVPVCLDTDWERIEAVATEEPLVEWATGDSLAYALYTSGSTGKPKGVLIEHRALMSYLASFIGMFELGPGDRVLQFASLAFDLSQAEIFSTWVSGGTLVSAPRDTLLSPEALADLLRRERVTYVGAPPAMLALVEPGPYPDLQHVLVGGEACPGDLVNRWNLPGRRFVNGYGPTEAAIGATMHRCERISWQSSPPIGGPLLHRRLYVVDRWGAPVPVGVPGELLIGGDEGLARGYLRQPELTAARFVADPFRPYGRVYRSGDLVRWTPERRLEFVGRIDTQVKLRGLRIELEEIEAVLAMHRQVSQAVVALRADSPGDKRLVGYVTPALPAAPPLVTDLRAHLGAHVPAYMVPTAWVFVDEIPLSANGKIDRATLPAPDPAADLLDGDRVPLKGAVEERLAEIFGDVLGEPRVGALDDFFVLGGSSLHAMRAIGRINRSFGSSLQVRTLFNASSVRTLAEHLNDASGSAEEQRQSAQPGLEDAPTERRLAEIIAEVLLRPAGSIPSGSHDTVAELGGDAGSEEALLRAITRRFGVEVGPRDVFRIPVLAAAVESAFWRRAATVPEQSTATARGGAPASVVTLKDAGGEVPLHCLPPVSGSSHVYVGLSRLLPSQRPVRAFEAPGLNTDVPVLERVEDLAAQYARALPELGQHESHLLLGWSMGGLVAYEMARQLIGLGARVTLIVIDAPPPIGGDVPEEPEILERFITDLAGLQGAPAAAVDLSRVGADCGRWTPGLYDELRRADLIPAEMEVDDLRRRFAVFGASVRAMHRYRSDWRFPGRLQVVRAAASPATAAGWAPYARQVTEHVSPGDHYSLWDVAHLQRLAATIRACLADVEEQGSGSPRSIATGGVS
jgi:amino acid adenylation domain-containing protein